MAELKGRKKHVVTGKVAEIKKTDEKVETKEEKKEAKIKVNPIKRAGSAHKKAGD